MVAVSACMLGQLRPVETPRSPLFSLSPVKLAPHTTGGRRSPLALLVVALVLLVMPMESLAQGERVPTAPDSGIQPPEVSASNIYVFDATAGVELYARNADQRVPIASTVKIATALVVMANTELDEEVTILESDLVEPPFSDMGVNGLTAGDTFTVEQLLVGLLVPSGSDAANALARHIGMNLADTEDPETGFNAFVDEMNNYVLSIGLKNTRFSNPAGDDSDNNYSSAHDLARLGGRLMRDQTLRAIVAQPTMSLKSIGPEQRPYADDGTNQLLGQRGVVGIKTGSTPDAGACLVSSRQVNDGRNTVITVVLGSDLAYDANDMIATDGRWADTEAIFNAMDDTFRWVAPAADGVFPGLDEQMAVWGVSMQEPPPIPVPNDPAYAIRYQLVLVPPDGEKATGRVLLYYGEDEVGSLPVYPTEANQTQVAA